MGNSFSSKNNNKALNFKKIKNNLNARNPISNSATGRHSVGILDKANNIKSNNEKNDIFTQIKNRNQSRENLGKSIKIKNAFDSNGDLKNNLNNKGVYNFEFYLDYNKIFSEVFSAQKKIVFIKQIEDLDNQIENEENYVNENIENVYEKEPNRLDLLNIKHYDDLINRNNIGKKLDFSERIDRKKSRLKESEKDFRERILNEELNVKVKSFLTALSKENTDDFLVAQKNDNLIEAQEKHQKINFKDKNLQKDYYNEKNINTIICNDKNCFYFLKVNENDNKQINQINEVSNKADMQQDDYLNNEDLKNFYISFKKEIIVNELLKDNNDIEVDEEEINSYGETKVKQNNLNLGLEETEDFEAANKLNCFYFDKKENNIKFAAENEEESTINLISNIGTPSKKFDRTNDFQFTEETKTKNDLNINSLIKLINKDSYFESPNDKNYEKFYESIEKEVKEFKSIDLQAANEALNKSTVSSSKENSKEFVCSDCINKNNLPNFKHKIKTNIKAKQEENQEQSIKKENQAKAKLREIKNLVSSSEKIKNNNILSLSEIEKVLNQKTFKSSSNLRNNYITKLICNNIWLPNSKPKNHNSIIIFDWDDTLLCTTFLTPNGIFYDNLKIEKKDLEKITKLESLTYSILNSSIEKGDTFIITNAAPGWVEYSAKRFYPKVFPLLSKIHIISARGEFEKKHPGDSRQWKILTFLKMVKIIDTKLVTNLICLGDSLIEMEAAHILASKFSHAFIKTVKFRENPSPEELFKQLQLILDQFEHIFSAVKNLTIKVERKNKSHFNNKTDYTSFQNLSNFDLSQIRNSLPNQPNGLKSAEKVKNK